MKKLYGVTCAMITPFDEKGKVDHGALRAHVDFLLEKGVDCLYPLGTTGEMYKLKEEERKMTAETVVKAADGRATVFIHTGAHDPDEVIALSKHASLIGADGVGVITPAFFGMSPREMIAYYENISRALPSDFPIYLYHLPQCTSVAFSPATAAKIAETSENVIGIKYSFADISETVRFLAIRERKFSVLQGADRLLLPVLAMGCDGTVSGCSSACPEPFVAVKKAYEAGDLELAREKQQEADEIADILRGGASAAWFKSALKWRGLFDSHVRAPQLDITPEEEKALWYALDRFYEKYGYEK